MTFYLALIFEKNYNNSMRIQELSVAEEWPQYYFFWNFTLLGHDFKMPGVPTMHYRDIVETYKNFILEALEKHPCIEIVCANMNVKAWSKYILGRCSNIKYVMSRTRSTLASIQEAKEPYFGGFVMFPSWGFSDLCQYHEMRKKEDSWFKCYENCSLVKLREMVKARLFFPFKDLHSTGILESLRSTTPPDSPNKRKYTESLRSTTPPDSPNKRKYTEDMEQIAVDDEGTLCIGEEETMRWGDVMDEIEAGVSSTNLGE